MQTSTKPTKLSFSKTAIVAACSRAITHAVFITVFLVSAAQAQTVYELNSGWRCAPIAEAKESGTVLSQNKFNLEKWMA
ncbi:hypothetical protein, partial [uncultured Mucilaginibacter sp.]|uniref:hypothetical protein n=1 Tax=uncultured Mucilaginibacter sp. TaxID=797541 RepID=UPI00262C1A5A